ncbi:MAG: hypothetical protein K5696_08170, partial [Lachnospiraceae bacterium]|nr:hypothetical protein [Lachnospiraceae bacterium]
GPQATISFTVVAAKSTKLSVVEETSSIVDQSKLESVFHVTKKQDSLSSLQLFTVDLPDTKDNENVFYVKAVTDNSSEMVWSSSNPQVVSVEGSSSKTSDWAMLAAKSTGTAKITCSTDDGSKKKTTFTVKVIVPVSDLRLTNGSLITYADPTGKEASFSALAWGKSVQVKATPGTAYGNPTVKKVTWSYKLGRINLDGADGGYEFTPLSESEEQSLIAQKIFSLKNGKVTISSKYATACGVESKIGMRVTATTTDGTALSASKFIVPAEPIRKITFGNRRSSAMITVPAQRDETGGYVCSAVMTVAYNYDMDTYYTYCKPAVKSSNPQVATGFSAEFGVLSICAGKPGTAKLTLTATDGTNRKATLTVKVKK